FLTPTETMLVEAKTAVGSRRNPRTSSEDSKTLAPAAVRMKLVGGNLSPELTGVEELPGKVNYIVGNNPDAWHTGVPLYSQVRSKQVYPGVGLVFHGDDQQLEYDFVLSPGAGPSRIVFQIAGATRKELTGDGDLVLGTYGSQIRMHKPVIYQLAGSERRPVAGAFALRANGEVSFQVAEYDLRQPLVIDPSITFASFLGGGGADNG